MVCLRLQKLKEKLNTIGHHGHILVSENRETCWGAPIRRT